MTLGSTDTQLDGKVAGDLLAFTEVLDVNGSLGGNAMIRGERLRIGPQADISGQIKYRGGRSPEVASGARLAGPVAILARGRARPNYASPGFYWRQVLAWAASFLLGIALYLVAPGFFNDIENASKRFGPCFGLGVLFLFATPIAAIIACLTIVGLGVGITTLLVYVIAIYAAGIFIGEWLGAKLLGPGTGAGAVIGRLALGLAVLALVAHNPVCGPAGCACRGDLGPGRSGSRDP